MVITKRTSSMTTNSGNTKLDGSLAPNVALPSSKNATDDAILAADVLPEIPVIGDINDFMGFIPQKGDMVISIPIFESSSEVRTVTPLEVEAQFMFHKIRDLIEIIPD